MKRWLMKSEPESYGIADLVRDGKTAWTGIRNYQARNYMVDGMKVGDPIFFYHSNAEPPGIAGLMRVMGPPIPDPTQFDTKSDYYEPRATKEKPVWLCVEVGDGIVAPTFVPLETLRKDKALAGMMLLQKGSRLSVQPVEAAAFTRICKLAGLTAPKSTRKDAYLGLVCVLDGARSNRQGTPGSPSQQGSPP